MRLPTVEPIAPEHLAFLASVDSPTIANAIESFDVRDRTEGFIGGRVRSLFPDLPPMVGSALTVSMSDAPGAVRSKHGFWAMFEALAQLPAPSSTTSWPTRAMSRGVMQRPPAARGAPARSTVTSASDSAPIGAHRCRESASA